MVEEPTTALINTWTEKEEMSYRKWSTWWNGAGTH